MHALSWRKSLGITLAITDISCAVLVLLPMWCVRTQRAKMYPPKVDKNPFNSNLLPFAYARINKRILRRAAHTTHHLLEEVQQLMASFDDRRKLSELIEKHTKVKDASANSIDEDGFKVISHYNKTLHPS